MISDKHLVDHLWKAQEVRKLSPADRDAVLAHAAEFAVDLYATDATITDFEAFGEDDLHGESSAAS